MDELIGAAIFFGIIYLIFGNSGKAKMGVFICWGLLAVAAAVLGILK